MIASQLESIEKAYQIINGKHLFYKLMSKCIKESRTSNRIEHFRRLLARSVKKEVGLHKDIVEIMQHILPSNPC